MWELTCLHVCHDVGGGDGTYASKCQSAVKAETTTRSAMEEGDADVFGQTVSAHALFATDIY